MFHISSSVITSPNPGMLLGKFRKAPCFHQALAAEFCVVEQKLIVVVPGMSGQIVWRGRIDAVLIGQAPVFLALELGTVAGGTMLFLQETASCDVATVQLVIGQ